LRLLTVGITIVSLVSLNGFRVRKTATLTSGSAVCVIVSTSSQRLGNPRMVRGVIGCANSPTLQLKKKQNNNSSYELFLTLNTYNL